MRKLIFLLMAMTGSTANAQLYGVASGTSSIYDVSMATGNATYIATVTEASGAAVSFTGAAFLGSDLWATDVFVSSLGTYTTGTINTSTGVYTPMSTQGGSWNWHGLAANQSAGLLYSIDLDQSGMLVSYDPVSGTITNIGGTGIDGRGMAYDNTTGTLYATGFDGSSVSLYTLSTSTGAASLIGNTGLSNYYTGLEIDESTGTLYLNDGNNNNLYSLSTSTGAATYIGPNNGFYTIDGLAMIPAPGSLALIGLGGLAAARRRR